MLPAVARSSRPHCWALNCAPSSQTVLRRLSSSALCRLQRAVAAAAVPMRTCESNTALRPPSVLLPGARVCRTPLNTAVSICPSSTAVGAETSSRPASRPTV
ncbi:hypothetical protein G6F24_016510 [Rhizopus arrhizus]|nr:hypothetical protein G6F24_016510 [Rhizopus arrhizus]